MEDEDTGCKDAYDSVSSSGRFITISYIDTTKIVCGHFDEILGTKSYTRRVEVTGCCTIFSWKRDPDRLTQQLPGGDYTDSVVIKEECEAVGNVQFLFFHGRLYKESLRREHDVCRGGWNI